MSKIRFVWCKVGRKPVGVLRHGDDGCFMHDTISMMRVVEVEETGVSRYDVAKDCDDDTIRLQR